MDQPPARFGLPKLRNPFVHRLQLSTLDKIQIVLLSVTLCPIRLLLVVLMLFFAAVFSFLALYGMDRHASQREPLPYWRNVIRPIPVFFCRMMFLAGGFHWITERGVRASSAEAPILVCGPHSSFYDALIVAYLGLTTVVVKSGTDNIPLVGTVLRYGQPILVHREDPDSRNSTVKEIRRRAAAKGQWPQVLIFPEGTCTNQTCLISYKPGAFIPGVPVQPVCVKYRNRMHTTPWTWNGPSALKQLWLTFANWNTQFEIEFLPVYVPNEAEKLDPLLFGRNVREVMAKALGVPKAEYTYEDGLAMMHSIQFPIAEQLTYVNSIVRTFQ
jgi:lysophosphatidylcholine acyltransferase/lyso-PAF acetyltransferase